MKTTYFSSIAPILRFALSTFLLSPMAFAGDVETFIGNLQSAFLNVLAPIICVSGIIFSGFKLALGDESAKRTLFWSCIGTAVTFTAPVLLSYFQNRVAVGT